MSLNDEMSTKIKEAEDIISQALPKKDGLIASVCEQMEYAVSAGGKRLRPIILLESCRMYSEKDSQAKYFAAALEMIHNYSLVHDDLPCMDNDSLRRGKPSVWAKYGECDAVLAGDALLNFAFETALKAFDISESLDEYKRVAKALEVLAAKAGIYGMIGGQVVDTQSEHLSQPLDENTINFIHKNKTAALLEAAFMCGGILGGASVEDVKILSDVAINVGLAFQIQDDILDIIGDEEKLGKPIGSDIKNEKQTYVSIHGMDKSKQAVKDLSDEAVEKLRSLNKESKFLEELIINLVGRDK